MWQCEGGVDVLKVLGEWFMAGSFCRLTLQWLECMTDGWDLVEKKESEDTCVFTVHGNQHTFTFNNEYRFATESSPRNVYDTFKEIVDAIMKLTNVKMKTIEKNTASPFVVWAHQRFTEWFDKSSWKTTTTRTTKEYGDINHDEHIMKTDTIRNNTHQHRCIVIDFRDPYYANCVYTVENDKHGYWYQSIIERRMNEKLQFKPPKTQDPWKTTPNEGQYIPVSPWEAIDRLMDVIGVGLGPPLPIGPMPARRRTRTSAHPRVADPTRSDMKVEDKIKEDLVNIFKRPGTVVLEICAGNGEFAQRTNEEHKTDIIATDLKYGDIREDASEAIMKYAHNVLLALHPMPMSKWNIHDDTGNQYLKKAILQQTQIDTNVKIIIVFRHDDYELATEKMFFKWMQTMHWYPIEIQYHLQHLLIFNYGDEYNHSPAGHRRPHQTAHGTPRHP